MWLTRELERQPAAVMLSFGDPLPFVEKIKRANSLVICQVQSLALAKEAVAAGAVILVGQGTEAVGRGASRELFTLLPEIVDAIEDQVLVVTAGGIADGRGVLRMRLQVGFRLRWRSRIWGMLR